MQEKIENAAASEEKDTNQTPVYKVDWSIEDPKERVKLVEKIVETTPPDKLTNYYLDYLAKYIIYAKTIKERKEKRPINTQNRMQTLNARQTSFEGLASKFENGEDGIYNMIINNDKNVLLTPKYRITQEEIDSIPELKQLVEEIKKVELQYKVAKGKKKYLLSQQIKEMRKDQYQIRNAYRPVTKCINLIKTISYLNLEDDFYIDEEGNIKNRGLISLFNPTHVSLLLCNYSKIKMECWDKLQSDIYHLMMDLEDAADAALKEKYPLYYDLMIYKIDGKSNLEIKTLLHQKYGINHSVEYISSLWRKKIPKLIAEYEEKRVLVWYYTEVEKGKWKRCSRCGQIKLAHNKFFSKNNTSKDGFYSICKECRNKKNK